jgi:DNA-binding GntR family transcriptional regulator
MARAPGGAGETKAGRVAKAPSRRRAPIFHEEVYAKLRRAIIDGQVEPGRSISVRSLAAQFSVSAMPAREAIRRLVALGALEMTKTRRITVARLSPRKADELTEARALIEPRLAVRALWTSCANEKSRTALVARLTRIDDKLDAAIEQGDAALYSKANSDFHFTFYAAAQAPVLFSVAESLWLQCGPFMRVVVQQLGASTMVDQHKEAIEALAAGDEAKLERAIRLDILEGMTRIGEAIGSA